MGTLLCRATIAGASVLAVACGDEFRAGPVPTDGDAGAGSTTLSTTSAGAGGGGTGGGEAGSGMGAVGGGAVGGGSVGGASPTCEPLDPLAPFPATTVLDTFEGTAIDDSWDGRLEAFRVEDGELAHEAGYYVDDSEILLDTMFCPDQEAWVTLTATDELAGSIGLQLKGDGTYNCEQLEVNYIPTSGSLSIVTCHGGFWSTPVLKPEMDLHAGDQLGARALADGSVHVYINGVSVMDEEVAWTRSSAGGRVGLAVYLGHGTARFDDFGGG